MERFGMSTTSQAMGWGWPQEAPSGNIDYADYAYQICKAFGVSWYLICNDKMGFGDFVMKNHPILFWFVKEFQGSCCPANMYSLWIWTRMREECSHRNTGRVASVCRTLLKGLTDTSYVVTFVCLLLGFSWIWLPRGSYSSACEFKEVVQPDGFAYMQRVTFMMLLLLLLLLFEVPCLFLDIIATNRI